MPIADPHQPSPRQRYAPAVRDIRQREAGHRYGDNLSPREGQTRRMDARIQRIHCHLLEQATDGLLTWRGDKIVRNR